MSTWAPSGQSPILRELCTRDHLSVIGALSLGGRVFFRVQDQSIRSQGVIAFLKHLLRFVEGKLLILWDGAPIHRSHAVEHFVRQEADGRLRLERFPAYAPDLDPVEWLWHQLKNVELRNLCCKGVSHLKSELRKAQMRLRVRPHILKACIRGAGL